MSPQIEDRLRSALRAEAAGQRLSPDAWQENQRRVSAAASWRSRKVLTVAAVGLAVAIWGGGIAFLAGGGLGGGLGDGPASGTGDPFTDEHLLGPPVEVERLTLDGQQTVHTIALSDMTGKGPNLCDEYASVSAATGDDASSSSSGGCTTRDPAADDDMVAFDWLTGTEGGGDIRGVTAGVDDRVSKVRIWMDNGDMVLATLHPTGWDDTKMFALTTEPSDAPTAQRLVAYGRDGHVLQAVDLGADLGDRWLQPNSCGSIDIGLSLPRADIGASSAEARIELQDGTGGVRQVCLPLESAIQGTTDRGDVILVLAPEVASVRYASGNDAIEVPPSRIAGAAWNAVLLRGAGELDGSVEIVAQDDTGRALDSQRIIGLL